MSHAFHLHVHQGSCCVDGFCQLGRLGIEQDCTLLDRNLKCEQELKRPYAGEASRRFRSQLDLM